MKTEYYISPMRITARIAETVVPGNHITIEGETFELITRAPMGKRVIRRLLNEDTNTRIKIYG